MKRDLSLSRDILLELELSENWTFQVEANSDDNIESQYHLELLKDAGFLEVMGKYSYRMTSKGHDFLDATRDDIVWSKTKTGAAKVGGMTLGMMKDLALAYVKQEAAEKLGIQL